MGLQKQVILVGGKRLQYRFVDARPHVAEGEQDALRIVQNLEGRLRLHGLQGVGQGL